MSGRRRGPAASLARCALWLASLPYRIVVRIRNRRFESGATPVAKCGIPVISIGNLTTGGTGKTPIVAWLAKWFRKSNVRVAIVSRGYGRGQMDQNDEAAELHQRLPDVPHLQDPNRVASATIAVEELETQVILMDDGFQHRHLHRDLDVVLIDATCPFGFGYLLPRGLLREPVANLRRANVVIITRTDQVPRSDLDKVFATVKKYNSAAPVLTCIHRPSGLLQYPSNVSPIKTLKGKQVGVLSGIGNPDAFHKTVSSSGAEIVGTHTLRDHADFGRETIQQIVAWIETLGPIDCVVCTHKDLVKLQTDQLAGKQILALLIDAMFEDSIPLESKLEEILSATPDI